MNEREDMRNTRMIFGLVLAGLLVLAGCNEPIDSTKEVTGTGAVSVSSRAGVKLTVDPMGGGYSVSVGEPAWVFSGTLGAALNGLQVEEAIDKIGRYKGVRFQWDGGSKRGTIRVYDAEMLVLFDVTYAQGVKKADVVFPNFTAFPKGLHEVSYQGTYGEKTSSLVKNGSPWLFFNDQGRSFILSAASNFMIAQMKGNGTSGVGCGFNDELETIPAGFSHQTLLAVGGGINATWQSWGAALMRKAGKQRPGKRADDSLKYLGYWTDEGAYYYYRCEADLGYENTLLAVKKHYVEKVAPFGYIQIGGWFYPKGVHTAGGELDLNLMTGGTTREDAAPSWTHSGGMMEYVADPAIFPKGTLEFRRFIGGRMMTHIGWMDVKSPYREMYEISGVAPVDEKFWRKGMDKLAMKGVDCLQQDYLNVIYDYSPALRSTVDVGEAFMGNMAAACDAQNITMQYCRAYPRHFLQGSKYQNLTTVRTSGGRFGRDCYDGHLYASRLGYAVGIWPWGGVCDTANTPDMLLMALSAGVVGVGEAMGSEDGTNIKKCVRGDGVIVKPDAPILPLDRCWVADAKGQRTPMIASTYTDHVAGKVYYVFAYTRGGDGGAVSFSPAELGAAGPVYVYDYYAGRGQFMALPEAVFSGQLVPANGGTGYYVVSPVNKNGIAVVGDAGKFVCCGESRIEEVSEYQTQAVVNVAFGKGDSRVRLIGYSNHRPKVRVHNGAAELETYDESSGLFGCVVEVTEGTRRTMRQGQDIARVVVTLE